MNTNESMQNEKAGKQWDQRTRKWMDKADGTIVEDTPEMEEARRRHNRSAGAGASGSKPAAKSDAPTAFPYFYTVLGVEVRARTAAESSQVAAIRTCLANVAAPSMSVHWTFQRIDHKDNSHPATHDHERAAYVP